MDFYYLCTVKITNNTLSKVMTEAQLLHVVFSFLPFSACLFWLICFIIKQRENDVPKQYFTVYIATCTLLYFCHARFFTIGLSHGLDSLWTLCSLSVYPLFYAYLCRLTSSHYTMRRLVPWLVPGAAVALAKYFLPDAGFDKVRLVLFAIQIITVCYLGIRKLKAFDRELQSVYADTEERNTSAVHHLLIAIIVVSLLSGIANSIGKQYFGESLTLLIPISIAFSTLLFALSYIAFNRDFSIDNLHNDESNEGETVQGQVVMEEAELIGQKIDLLIRDEHYFTRKDLKIGDLVVEVGSNRTYVSNYINRTYKCSFSELTNKLRIEYAKRLLANSEKGVKLSQIAEDSGFASEQSFYRNFKKFAGMTPAEWMKGHSAM